MSCIHFNTDAQREQLKAAKKNHEPIAKWSSPGATESKLERIRLMALDKNSKIRESAALSVHITQPIAMQLANDKNELVRVCVARNENVPRSVLEVLGQDKSSTVRCWVALNPNTPRETFEQLLLDDVQDVRQIASLQESARDSHPHQQSDTPIQP